VLVFLGFLPSFFHIQELPTTMVEGLGSPNREGLHAPMEMAKEPAMREVSVALQKNMCAMAIAKANCVAKHKVEKEAAVRRCELKGKAVCVEDSKARRSARQATSIAQFFTSSRNAISRQHISLEFDFMHCCSGS